MSLYRDPTPAPAQDGSAPTLTFAVHEDGTWERISPWFPFVAFAESLIARADGWRLVLDGDELTVVCSNGQGTYRLSVPEGGTRIGRLVRYS